MNVSSDDLAAQWQQTRIDLAARALGGDVLDSSDDFFAEKDNLLLAEDPIFLPEKYTAYGKWMDGWESRRRRDAPGYEGCDWVTVRLASVGEIEALDVDTRHFKGNAPGAVQLDYLLADEDPNEQSNWQPLTDRIAVKADFRNLITLDQPTLKPALQSRVASHIRLRIYPDGGVARLRVYGKIHLDQRYRLPREPLDLAALMNGGRSVACSDSFFSPMQNLLLPGRGADMHNGWETKRRRQGGNDWMVVKLALPGTVHRVEVDTLHFKGNYPDRCSLEACSFNGDNPLEQPENAADTVQWHTILPEQKLHAHRNHFFLNELQNTEQQYTHVRLNIFPDGGVSRLRVFGFESGHESGFEGSDS